MKNGRNTAGKFTSGNTGRPKGASSVLTAVSEGELNPFERTRVIGLIDSYRRNLELTEIEERLQALENAH